MDERKPVFETLPSGLDIARWFRDEEFAHRFQNVGGDATWLCREPHGALWHLATVDHDDQMFFLLVVITDGVQDLLFVTSGLRCALACEWRNQPTKEQDWGRAAIVWFADMIEQYEAVWGDEWEAHDPVETDTTEQGANPEPQQRDIGPEDAV